MASAQDYANWIVNNADKKGTPEFDTVVKAYQAARAGEQPPAAAEAPAEGMPAARAPRAIPPRAVTGAAIKEIYDRAGGPAAYLGEAASAFGRGAATNILTLGGLGDVTGGGIGATTPQVKEATGFEETPTQYMPYEMLGSLVGPGLVVKPVVGAARAGRSGVEAIQNYLNPKNLALLQSAEGRGADIVNALRNPAREIVPGSAPTAGQAATPAGATKYSALQQQVAKELPSEYYQRAQEQGAARMRLIKEVGGTPEDLAAAEATRKNVTDPMYEGAKAATGPIDTRSLTEYIDSVVKDNPGNRDLVREMTAIKNNMAGLTTPRELASVLDDVKASLKKQENKFITGHLTEVKAQLEDAIPSYKGAQETFKELSQPINTMEIGQYLEGKLAPALDETAKQRATVYAGALENAPATIKSATGMPRFESLSQILKPEDVAKLEAIRSDLAREAKDTAMARAAGAQLPATERTAIPSMLNRVATIANEVMKKLQGRIDRKVAIELATEMLNPEMAASALENAMKWKAQQEAVGQAFRRGGQAAATAARVAGRTGTAINALAPENQNALAQ
jgi:hypothetical protein